MPHVFVSGPRDMRMQKNPGNARVCLGLQVPMAEPWLSITIQLSNDGFLNMALPLLNSYYIV